MNSQQQLLNELTALVNDSSRARQVDSKVLQEKLLRLKEIANNLNFHEEPSTVWQDLIAALRGCDRQQDLLTQAVRGLQEALKLDRVLVYQLAGEVVVAEALTPGFTPALAQKLPIVFVGNGEAVTIADVSRGEFTPYQKQLWEQYQVRAMVASPLLVEGKLWGVLVGHQCSGTKDWTKAELTGWERVAQEVEAQLLVQRVKGEMAQWQALSDYAQQIQAKIQRLQPSQSLEQLLHVVTIDVRQALQVDRVAIYQFAADWTGDYIVEAVAPGVPPLVGVSIADEHFHSLKGGRFAKGESLVVDDIHNGKVASCLVPVLEQFQAKALISVPIRVEENWRLWGLLEVYQNDRARQWQPAEVQFLQTVSQILEKYLAYHAFSAYQKLDQLGSRLNNTQNVTELLQVATQEALYRFHLDRAAVYQFNPDWSGDYIVEACAPGMLPLVGNSTKDECFQEMKGGRYVSREIFVINDVDKSDLDAKHKKLLAGAEVRSYVSVPLFVGDRLWGLLLFYSRKVRHWQNLEIKLMEHLGQVVSQSLSYRQQQDYLDRFEKQEEEATKFIYQLGQRNVVQMQERSSLENIFAYTTKELRRVLKADRAVVYQFFADWSGRFIYEDVGEEWIKLVGSDLKDEYLQQTQGGRYRLGESLRVDDIYSQTKDECHLNLLKQWGTRAYMLTPIFEGQKLWGILGVYQNSGPRHWENYELDVLIQAGVQLSIALQQAEYLDQIEARSQALTRKAELERVLNKITEKVRLAQDLDTIFRVTTEEMRLAVGTDRAVVYQFNPDFSGQVVAESVGAGWVSLLIEQQNDPVLQGDRTQNDRCILRKWSSGDIIERDTYLQETRGGKYAQGEIFTAIDDIYAQNFPACYVASLEKYQAKAYVIAPVYQSGKLWGLVGIYQNTGARKWTDDECFFVKRIAQQLGLALQQAEYLKEIQARSEELTQIANLERTLNRISDKIRQTQELEIDTIFRVVTQEIRQALKADRTVVYQFNPDFSGQVIAESVGAGWVSLLIEQTTDEVLRGDRTQNDRCILRKWAGADIIDRDTYLQETKGGKYAEGVTCTVVEDIYQQNFPQCYINSLEKYQARAYIIVPIYQKGKLWGLVGAYQNSGPRQWKESEVTFMQQTAQQLIVALQQAEYLAQIQAQAEQLAIAAEREKQARENLQQSALRILRAIEPSFKGDLTVRAPLSEDEVGTIADGYNTTIQTLRELVRQVQGAATRVTQASSSNSAAVSELSQQAQEQVNKLEQALQYLQQMLHSVEAITTSAQTVQQSVEEANRVVQQGDSLAELTVASILEVRETVSETAKKIKRLGESSQKISKVVNLIENFATQTNLLALNAAIEATRAGEFGRGFAVVADEVRSLAYQSANATTEIERLVQEIQTETNGVIEAMEMGISQVVKGSNLVNETRQSLQSIAQLTQKISELVTGITQATQVEEQQSQIVTQQMNDVATIAHRTSVRAAEIAQAFQELLQTAQALEITVSKFKVD
ncbi:MAG: GAF domain-containing protein [Pseudanabaenaceae cyanobacterium SKYGB_i_bin29]|nr:GAF domain-containing protein [Pseudanabaenaceae cyanobacterium SKYG29]MDW8422495.1 GAF domain-containing protein [Pseudanabaenaceae cyanobacterium SKYGB_i_bin29]